MIRISDLKIKIPHDEKKLIRMIRKNAGGDTPLEYRIVRRSLDARKKPDLYYVYTIDASFRNESRILRSYESSWKKVKDTTYQFPIKNRCFPDKNDAGNRKNRERSMTRPVIVGFGPAGIFAALMLARAGFAPIVLERGDEVDLRRAKVEEFFRGGSLDPDSNIQFGEGGAGTFSDGKLNTMVKDRSGRNTFVLREFVRHGAPENILYEAKPHVGTDILRGVVASLRKEILSLGGEIRFRAKMTDIEMEGDALTGVIFLEGDDKKRIPADTLILAPGHSARDTFAALYDRGLIMIPKAFAVGIRVEHPAKMINDSMYGPAYPEELPAASYKLTHQCHGGRGIYSFCMCPGGYVVNSSSEEGYLCVNGMSYSDRKGLNSNSAIITTVTPEDFPSPHPLAGMEFQRHLEKAAYSLCDGAIPVQLYRDFRRNQVSTSLESFKPQILGRWAFGNLRNCLPDYICDCILEGMEAFGGKIEGYNSGDTVFSGVETRTSSPVRILRDREGHSNVRGVFPCGEGAGYAGGITSAAMDGIRMAEAAADYMLKNI